MTPPKHNTADLPVDPRPVAGGILERVPAKGEAVRGLREGSTPPHVPEEHINKAVSTTRLSHSFLPPDVTLPNTPFCASLLAHFDANPEHFAGPPTWDDSSSSSSSTLEHHDDTTITPQLPTCVQHVSDDEHGAAERRATHSNRITPCDYRNKANRGPDAIENYLVKKLNLGPVASVLYTVALKFSMEIDELIGPD